MASVPYFSVWGLARIKCGAETAAAPIVLVLCFGKQKTKTTARGPLSCVFVFCSGLWGNSRERLPSSPPHPPFLCGLQPPCSFNFVMGIRNGMMVSYAAPETGDIVNNTTILHYQA